MQAREEGERALAKAREEKTEAVAQASEPTPPLPPLVLSGHAASLTPY